MNEKTRLSRKYKAIGLSFCIAANIAFIMLPTSNAQTDNRQNISKKQTVLFEKVLDDHWAMTLEQNPTLATSTGVRIYDHKLGSNSLASYAATVEFSKSILTRLETVQWERLSADNQVNYKLITQELQNTILENQYGDKYLLTTNREGPHTFLAGLPESLPFFVKSDYESYIQRMNDIPRYMSETLDTYKAGIKAGWTQPCEGMVGVDQSIRYHVVNDVKDSVFQKPFATKPANINAADWGVLKTNANKAIIENVIPAFKSYADFYETDYAPACRKTIGASTLPDGEDYYQFKANFYTTTEATPDEIHNIGLGEVARIRAEMATIIEGVNYEGSFKEFQNFLRTDPQFYAKTEEELVAVTSVISKRIDGELPRLFNLIPRIPYTVKPVPADIAEGTTTAYYEPGAADGTRAGVYRINTSLLDQRPLFELEALSLHEAVPGHHFQIALAQELDLPPFRTNGGFTAFVEGWGLYAESLGLDVGFYQDPYANFGRLSYEMWRACRLVVDTGMHAKGWTRQQAIDFMTDNTALSDHNIKSEIDRYITWPGQALAYKTGQLKIKKLREKASNALGDKFDLRRFHDAVLENGAIPLSVLEDNIDAFIKREENKE